MDQVPRRTGLALATDAAQRQRWQTWAAHGPRGHLRHCLTGAVRLEGRLDRAALRARIDTVLRRRPALRSTFPDADTQVITETRVVVVDVDAIGPDPDSRWRHALSIAADETENPFVPTSQARARLTLIHVEPQVHLLVLAIDPLVCDAWSVQLLIDDLVDGADTREEPADDGYESVWLGRREWLESPSGAAALADRRRVLAGVADRWPLPAPSDPGQEESTEAYRAVPAELTDVIRETLRRERTTLLALGAAAAQLALGDGSPLALRSLLASRETPREQGVVAAMATQVLIRLPPPAGRIREHMASLRSEVFGVLSSSRVQSASVSDVLAPGTRQGATVAVMYLPREVSGGGQTDLTLAGARADRTAVSVCPTGADVELFLLEGGPPVPGVGAADLTVGAASWRGDSTQQVEEFLDRWLRTLAALVGIDWSLPCSALGHHEPRERET